MQRYNNFLNKKCFYAKKWRKRKITMPLSPVIVPVGVVAVPAVTAVVPVIVGVAVAAGVAAVIIFIPARLLKGASVE